MRQHALLDLGFARQFLGLRHVRHLGLMGQPGLVAMERHRHGEDRVAVLDRDHAPGGEALAVADAVDLVDDRHLGIARRAGNRRAANAAGARPRRRCGRRRPAPARSPGRRTRAASVTCGLRPRNRFTSSGSRSRMARRFSIAEDIAASFFQQSSTQADDPVTDTIAIASATGCPAFAGCDNGYIHRGRRPWCHCLKRKSASTC